MASIPRRFNLAGGEWKVRFTEKAYLNGKLQHGFEGICITNKKTGRREIFISPGLMRNRKRRWIVFAHELLHAFQDEMGELRRERGWIKAPISHAQIRKLAIPLACFLDTNVAGWKKPDPSNGAGFLRAVRRALLETTGSARRARRRPTSRRGIGKTARSRRSS